MFYSIFDDKNKKRLPSETLEKSYRPQTFNGISNLLNKKLHLCLLKNICCNISNHANIIPYCSVNCFECITLQRKFNRIKKISYMSQINF